MKMYVLKSGESLQQVAANKNMPFRTLLDANPDLSAHNEWPAGTKVRIPTVVLRTSNERDVTESHEHPLHSYYEEQKRWLERLQRSRMMQVPCFPQFSQSHRDVPQNFERDEEQLEREAGEGDGEHDEHEERREQHQKRNVKSGPKPKKRIKRKKRKHTHHREHRHSQREAHHIDDDESHEPGCLSEEPHLPWLNV